MNKRTHKIWCLTDKDAPEEIESILRNRTDYEVIVDIAYADAFKIAMDRYKKDNGYKKPTLISERASLCGPYKPTEQMKKLIPLDIAEIYNVLCTKVNAENDEVVCATSYYGDDTIEEIESILEEKIGHKVRLYSSDAYYFNLDMRQYREDCEREKQEIKDETLSHKLPYCPTKEMMSLIPLEMAEELQIVCYAVLKNCYGFAVSIGYNESRWDSKRLKKILDAIFDENYTLIPTTKEMFNRYLSDYRDLMNKENEL
jgi:hypothetical protein